MLHELTHASEMAGLSSARILESLQHPVLVADANSEITYANATAAVSFGGWIVGLMMADLFTDYLKPGSLNDGPVSIKLVSRQNETYDALLNPIGNGDTCFSLWRSRRKPTIG